MSENEFLLQINENKGLIMRLINLYLDSPEEKEDMFQEIILRSWTSKNQFLGKSKFSTWLYKVSLNSILTGLKKRNRITITPINNTIAELPQDENDLENELRNKLYKEIKLLDNVDKTMISMHLDGFSNPEIAEFMGISINNCNVKLFRIKKKLTNNLNKK